jgi:anti-sigma-K factor RskA
MTDFSDDEAFAAEYALGTLDAAERASAEQRRRREPAFDGLVTAWETRLAPLASATPEIAPPATVLTDILARLPPDRAAAGTGTIVTQRRRLRAWRNVALATGALAAAEAIWILGSGYVLPPTPRQTYVAVLQHGVDTPAFVVSVDLADHRMTVLPLATTAPPGKSYELWMITPGDGTPHSMGVVDAQAGMRPHLPDMNKGEISSATYAVTVEPRGGSPTGQPTSAPVYVGKLLPMAL